MTQIELVHRINEKVSSARYIAATPGYKEQQLDKVLEEIEYFAKQLIELRDKGEG